MRVSKSDSPAAGPRVLRHALALFVLIAVSSGCGKREAQGPRTVVLISIDTLRADHLSCYDYARETSPVIDAQLAANGVVFERAHAQATYTLPSHMSMMTSLYTDSHGMLQSRTAEGPALLADEAVTLAESLRDDGFTTLALTDGGYVSAEFGFDQGFDEYIGKYNAFRDRGDTVRDWLDENDGNDMFLFLHSFDVHGPYIVDAPFQEKFVGQPGAANAPATSLFGASHCTGFDSLQLHRFDSVSDVIDFYDGCISFVDAELARIFDALRAHDRFDDAMIILTSDHGEAFLENGVMVGHGILPTVAETHVPLIVKFPGNALAGRRERHIVEVIDIMPTILGEFGIEGPHAMFGQDLRAGVTRGQWDKEHAFGTCPNSGNNAYLILDDVFFVERLVRPPRRIVKWFFKPAEPVRRLHGDDYDLHADPLGLIEAMPLEDRAFLTGASGSDFRAPRITDAERLRDLRQRTRAIREQALAAALARTTASGSVSSTIADQLAALGYVQEAAPVEAVTDTRSNQRFEQADAKRARHPRKGIDFEDPTIRRADDLLWQVRRELRGKTGREREALLQRHEQQITQARTLHEQAIEARPTLQTFLEWRWKLP